ncbi:MAG: 8-amino-7-oxononanoate synthase [Chitinophagaceae bacterium]
MNDSFLYQRLQKREVENALRALSVNPAGIDFSSNDYLGIVRNNLLNEENSAHLKTGSTGSRLLTGNSALAEELEKYIADFHAAPAGLLFNSGYDANTGLLGSVAGREDTLIYDYLSHASIRDGIRLSNATSFSFHHNDLADLSKKLAVAKGHVFVVIESVYSMDGDQPPLREIVELCKQSGAHLIVDEAHATGVVGDKGEGLVQKLSLEQDCFARIHTFGKACGAMGAVVLGSTLLRDFLVNFCRSFIYTTAMPEISLRHVLQSYRTFPSMKKEREALAELITIFHSLDLPFQISNSHTAVQAVIIEGNERVKMMASRLQENGLDIRPILYPSVQKGAERLRVVLHSFNQAEELTLFEKILNR